MMKKAGDGQPGVPARRSRQDVDGLPRRPVVGAARGARPRAEPHVRGPLPRRRVRPVAGDVHRTANIADPIPPASAGPDGGDPALRLHAHEKIAIARQFLVPKQREGNGLKAEQIDFTDDADSGAIIERYTREAGVRNLEREIGGICRKVARQIVQKKRRDARSASRPRTSKDFLGVPRFRKRRKGEVHRGRRRDRPGLDRGGRRDPRDRDEPAEAARAT